MTASSSRSSLPMTPLAAISPSFLPKPPASSPKCRTMARSSRMRAPAVAKMSESFWRAAYTSFSTSASSASAASRSLNQFGKVRTRASGK